MAIDGMVFSPLTRQAYTLPIDRSSGPLPGGFGPRRQIERELQHYRQLKCIYPGCMLVLCVHGDYAGAALVVRTYCRRAAFGPQGARSAP